MGLVRHDKALLFQHPLNFLIAGVVIGFNPSLFLGCRALGDHIHARDGGQRLRLSGEGEHGEAGGAPGDLYVVVHVRDHEFFQREDDDLHCAVPVSFPTLALGGTIEVPTLAGNDTIPVPKGTPTEARFRLRSKGLPRVSGRGRGDLYVTVRVEVPTSLTREQKSLITELDKTMPSGKTSPIRPVAADEDDRPFFDRVKDIFG